MTRNVSGRRAELKFAPRHRTKSELGANFTPSGETSEGKGDVTDPTPDLRRNMNASDVAEGSRVCNGGWPGSATTTIVAK